MDRDPGSETQFGREGGADPRISPNHPFDGEGSVHTHPLVALHRPGGLLRITHHTQRDGEIHWRSPRGIGGGREGHCHRPQRSHRQRHPKNGGDPDFGIVLREQGFPQPPISDGGRVPTRFRTRGGRWCVHRRGGGRGGRVGPGGAGDAIGSPLDRSPHPGEPVDLPRGEHGRDALPGVFDSQGFHRDPHPQAHRGQFRGRGRYLRARLFRQTRLFVHVPPASQTDHRGV
mmetsp:Transcript_33837/g.39196  ORF Transcript_33837/g.39196 Transcript_33837/m.39196 type:complete len:230 (-) Transcript_33837:1073-1762(-)